VMRQTVILGCSNERTINSLLSLLFPFTTKHTKVTKFGKDYTQAKPPRNLTGGNGDNRVFVKKLSPFPLFPPVKYLIFVIFLSFAVKISPPKLCALAPLREIFRILLAAATPRWALRGDIPSGKTHPPWSTGSNLRKTPFFSNSW
jgi:hypothetical protein